jgi:hypothetical protein
MKTILKITLPFDEGALKSEFILPEKKLTLDEASWIMVVLDNLIMGDLMCDEKVKEIFQDRGIMEYSVGSETAAVGDTSCKLL